MLSEGEIRPNGRPVLVVEDSENNAAMLEIALADIPGVTIVVDRKSVV